MVLVDITGVGPVTARLLTESGLATVTSVAEADVSTLVSIRGIGPVSAESIKAEAVRLVGMTEPGPTEDPGITTSNRERRGTDLRKRAKKLRTQAEQRTQKAKSAKSKKKRKRLADEAAKLEKAAKKARRKAKKFLAG